MKYKGYHSEHQLPIRRGEQVVIPKGVTVHTTHPKRDTYVTARKQRVTVDHILPGRSEGGRHLENPKVRWAGSGGYWCEVDINNLA